MPTRLSLKPPTIAKTWSAKYRQRHLPERVVSFPKGVSPPHKVRIYSRADHFLLHFWDPAVKRTLYDRVNGDLIDSIARARQIDQKLDNFRASGQVGRRLNHQELVEHFRRDLDRRADAGAIAVGTARRYSSAIGHYLDFARQLPVASAYPHAARVDRQFALDFAAYLGALRISPNGRANSVKTKMKGQNFVLDAVRALFEWAADPDRGHLLPAGFRNPFCRRVVERRRVALDRAGEPDITIAMAENFLQACDDWQLRLFAPIAMYGLRPSEMIYLFYEELNEQTLNVGCIEELAYMTKGRRNKRLPMLPSIYALLHASSPESEHGLIFRHRRAIDDNGQTPLLSASRKDLIQEFERRSNKNAASSAIQLIKTRNELLREAGALTYKIIEGEFTGIAKSLNWPAAATLKDLRHLCNTALANGGMPEHERRYLLGQDPGRDAIVTYTHFNKLTEHYQSAAEREMGPLLDVLKRRTL